jgi:hypothetical protein
MNAIKNFIIMRYFVNASHALKRLLLMPAGIFLSYPRVVESLWSKVQLSTGFETWAIGVS